MSTSRRQEINQQLKELETTRNNLLLELAKLPSDPEPPLSQQILGTTICDTSPSTSAERLSLFTRLFRCREDVFPKLWENKTKGIKGYSPACQVEWIHGICEKPKIKCSECRNREFIPLDESVIRGHLEGTFTVGTYAIRTDDTCTFLVADFDKEQWQKDVAAYKNTARKLGIESYIERSRSGNGAHAWIFLQNQYQQDPLASLEQSYCRMQWEKGIGLLSKVMIGFFRTRIPCPKGALAI